MDMVQRLSQCIASVLVLIVSTTAWAQSVSDLGEEVNSFDKRISGLEQRYLKPAMLASKYKLEARYNDARVAYFLQDFNRASILLVDVVRNEKFRDFSSYREAIFLLGDSLFQTRNYIAARRYFQQLLEMGSGPFYEDAAGRLLQIAYETGDFDSLDELYAQLQGENMSGALAYLSGKAFYEQGNQERARENFSRAAQSPEYTILAEYFRGVSFVADRRLDDAEKVFRGVVNNTTPRNERDLEVVDLAWLALGRVAYEKGNVERAIDQYSRIARTSKHFDRALWEQTWVLVSRGNFEEARRNVDILTYFKDPDPDLVADAELLRADLSLKLGEYETARADYEAVLDRFTPVKKQMDEFTVKHKDLPSFFAALVEEELAGVESEYMPPLVTEWIANDPDMRAASELLSDVRGVEEEIDDTYRMLDEISARLNSSTRIQSFPTLADGMSLGVAAENRLVEIRQDLLQRSYEAKSASMGASDKQRWKQILGDLDRLQKKFEQVPVTREEIGKRERMLSSEFARLRRRIDRVGYQLDAQRAQLNAVDQYLEHEYGRPLTAKEKRRVDTLRAELRQGLKELGDLKEELEHELERNRQQVGVGDAVMVAEANLRQQYRLKLNEAQQFLAAFSAGADVARIDAILQKIPRLEKRLDKYFGRMNELIDEKVGELRQDVAVERQLMDSHRLSMQQLVNASQGGAGVLAYLNFMRARAEFNEIILRGDVGIIDVVWKKKEDMSNKISRLFQERTTELRLLQEAFEEVR
jgi:tetratricopeptide (TPR) repeat protein